MLNECNFCNHNVDDSCQLDVNGCQTNMYEMFDGKIQEVFKSQDGTFNCFWIENEIELITEQQLI